MLTAYVRAMQRARASYTPDKRASERESDLPSYLAYRPLSFLLTPAFEWLGLSANGVTVLGLLLAMLMPVAAHVGKPYGALWVSVLAVSFQVLDCVDGNLARMQRASSKVGEMLDSITSLLFWALYMMSVGIAAEAHSTRPIATYGVEIGLGLAAMLLAQRELEDTFEAYCGERVRWTPPALPQAPKLDVSRFGRVIEQVFAFGLFALAGLYERLDLFLMLIGGYQAALLAIWLVRFSGRVRARMQSAAMEAQPALERDA